MEQGRGDGHVVHADVLGRDQGHLQRMRDVELARGAAVVAVRPVRDAEGPPDQALVYRAQVALAMLQEHAEAALVLGRDDEDVEVAVEVGGGGDHGRGASPMNARAPRVGPGR